MKLWIAQGFGIGRIPVAPGTFGSLVGVLWFALLLRTGSPWVLAAGTLATVALSVWLCGEAERILGQKDPGSVVLDEIAAMPVCFFGWVAIQAWKSGALPGLAAFFSAHTWWNTRRLCRFPLLRCRQALAGVSEPVVARRLGGDD